MENEDLNAMDEFKKYLMATTDEKQSSRSGAVSPSDCLENELTLYTRIY